MTARHAIDLNRDVYLFSGGPRHVKIGISANPQKRVYELQTGCPFRIQLIATWKTQRATEVEGKAHKVLDKYRVAGEWFDIPVETARLTIERILRQFPRNRALVVESNHSVVFCGNCGHSAEAVVPKEKTVRFKCSKCGRRERIEVVDF